MPGQQDQGRGVGGAAGVHVGAAEVELFYRDSPAAEEGVVRVLEGHEVENSSLSEVICRACVKE